MENHNQGLPNILTWRFLYGQGDQVDIELATVGNETVERFRNVPKELAARIRSLIQIAQETAAAANMRDVKDLPLIFVRTQT